MDHIAEEIAVASWESSPLTTPPASTPGTSPMRASREGSIAVSSDTALDQPSCIVTLKIPGRLAARRAQMAIKRTFEDLDSGVIENPTKRIRRDVAAVGETGQSPHMEEAGSSQSTVDNDYAEDSQEQPMLTILGSMAGANKKAAGSSQIKAIRAAPNTTRPAGRPLVWANGRGALCEALPYFKAYKGSLHSANVVAQGFLIDQEADDIDVFGAQVIISSV